MLDLRVIRLQTVLSVAIAVFWQTSAQAADPADIFKKKIRQMFGSDFKHYEWFSHPTNNFGVATMFVLQDSSEKPGDRNQWCASLTCLGLNSAPAPRSTADRLKLNGFADVGNGPPLRLEDEGDRRIVAGGLLAQMFQIIGVGVSAEVARTIKSTLEFGPSTKRILNKQKTLDHINSLPVTSPIRQAMNERRFAIVVADVVIESMAATISTTGQQTAGMESFLQNLPSRLVGRGGDLRFRVTRSNRGEYKLTVNEPLVIARLVVARPFGTRSGEAAPSQTKVELEEWNDWVLAGSGKP